MKLLGITGGIGMGKSVFAEALIRRGIPVADTDALARELAAPGTEGFQHIVRRFGGGIVRGDGQIDRQQLGQIVFSDAAARRDLELILHPRIRECWQGAVARWRCEGRELSAVVIPLLFETDAAPLFDTVLCVACTRVTQSGRLLSRGWTMADMAARLKAQLSIEEKIARSNFVIWNEGRVENLPAQWELIRPWV